MNLKAFALALFILAPTSFCYAHRCEVDSQKIIDEIGAIVENGRDEIDAQAAATETCMDRYQKRKRLSQDDAFDLCVNYVNCKKAPKTL